MFEDALLDSSPGETSVLLRIHYLLSALVGTLVFALGVHVLPMLLALMDQRALLIAAAIAGVAGSAYAMLLCYVWADSRQQHLCTWLWFGIAMCLILPGFLLYLISSARKSGDWKRAAIPLAYLAESMLVGALILAPLINTQALPKQLLIGQMHIPAPPGPPPGRPTAQRARPAPHAAVDLSTAPARIPNGIQRVIERLEPTEQDVGSWQGVIGAPPGESYGGPGNWVIGNLLGGKESPPPPPVGRSTPKTRIVRVGGKVIAARALYQPVPVYPPLAKMARIQGVVVLQAIIGTDGTVQDLKVLSGHPLLIRAAIDAVRTWRYQPTLLNTEPVEVLTEIDVNFRLGE